MMKKKATTVAFFFAGLICFLEGAPCFAQEAIYRCGNQYTNDVAQAKREKCTLLDTGISVTVPGKKASQENPSHKPKTPPSSTQMATPQQKLQQQQWDRDAKAVIEAELQKTQQQLIQLRQQYDLAVTTQDAQRKRSLTEQIARAEADIASLQRELKR